MVTGTDVVWLPSMSVTTACTCYAAGGRGPVIQVTAPSQALELHVIVANTPPLPHSLRLVSPALPLALTLTLMLLPVHVPLAGDVMRTVGGVGPLPGPFAMVTVIDAVAVRPPP